jgi:hypothetical protein
MKIALTDGGVSGELELVNPDALPWVRRKPQCWHAFHSDARLSQPFNQVFLKRWFNRKAPAHELLVKLHKDPLPGMPRVYGYERMGRDFVYVFQRMPRGFRTVYDYIHDDWQAFLTPEMGKLIVTETAQILDKILNADHVFTDYTVENMMLNRKTNELILIDIDSAWPLRGLINRGGIPEANQFCISFWDLWIEHMLKQLGRRNDAGELLGKSMIVSFAAVWARVLGLINNPQLAASRMLLLTPASFEKSQVLSQEPFWNALHQRDMSKFEKYLQYKQYTQGLFEEWQDIFQVLTEGDHVRWGQVVTATERLLSLYPDPVVVPPDDNKVGYFKLFSAHLKKQWASTRKEFVYGVGVIFAWVKSGGKSIRIHKGVTASPPGDDAIDWAVVRRNLYDPLRIISLTRRLLS